ncbi:MAG: anaerobic ribonucleoside-triphosphate reductase [Eubacteriales bacterium]
MLSPMGCRSFLSPWKDENGNYKFEGRFNQGVVSLNLPQIGILARGDEEKFWQLLDQRLQLCFEALMCRHNALKNVRSDSSPIHWQYGAIARLPKGAPIEPLLYGGYSSISLGYIGLYEVTKLVKGCSQTTPEGQAFSLKVMERLRSACDTWKKETNIGFALYGTPAESLCYRFARIDKERFGTIPDVTDKGYYTNSYHVDVREHIDAFSKFTFESQFQEDLHRGCISYVEIPNMRHNLEALKRWSGSSTTTSSTPSSTPRATTASAAGYDGEITINDDLQWECPVCHNTDQAKMNVTRRTCGYLGENYWNVGKTKEIKSRVLHL